MCLQCCNRWYPVHVSEKIDVFQRRSHMRACVRRDMLWILKRRSVDASASQIRTSAECDSASAEQGCLQECRGAFCHHVRLIESIPSGLADRPGDWFCRLDGKAWSDCKRPMRFCCAVSPSKSSSAYPPKEMLGESDNAACRNVESYGSRLRE